MITTAMTSSLDNQEDDVKGLVSDPFSMVSSTRFARSHQFRRRPSSSRFPDPTNNDSAKLTRLTTRPPLNAAQKSATWKPRPSASDRAPVSQSMNALRTKMNSPRLTISSGNVSSVRTGRHQRVQDPEDERDGKKETPVTRKRDSRHQSRGRPARQR